MKPFSKSNVIILFKKYRHYWVISAVVMASTLMCSLPSIGGGGDIDPTFAAIMTSAAEGGDGRTQPAPTSTDAAPQPSPIPTLFNSSTPELFSTPTFEGGIILTPSPPPSPTPQDWSGAATGKIVFTCYVENVDQICLMDAHGNNVQRLTNHPATEFYGSLSPDGQQILFSSRRESIPFEIYQMNVDGSNQTRLTQGLGSLYAPAYSPDGEQIVFTRESGRRFSIWIMDADGGNPRPVEGELLNGIDPTWSPDGSQIAFASNRDGSLQLYVINVDGTELRQVTRDIPDIGGRHSWSPDGQTLAFYAGPQGDHNIFVIDIDGNNIRQLTQGGDNLAPSFSPDGQWITFTTFRDRNNEIYRMRPDGSEVTRLTNDRRPDWQPRWGP